MNWEEIWPKIQDFGLKYGPPFLWAIVTLVVGWIAAKIVRTILKKAMRKAKMDDTLVGFFANLVYMLILAFVVIAALGKVGVQTGSFVAIVGAAGLAIGFALQGSLANFAAGVMIILFRPFRLGDYIEGGGAAGSVEEILIFSTMLKTPDNKKIIVPNSSLMSGNIVNYSAKDVRRVDMVFGIGYGDDIREAKQVLEGLLANHELILKDPAPQVVVGELADSSVNFNVRPWVKTADYWTVYFDITEAVKIEFDSKGISIPFPQQDVHMHQVA
jgi:small conductance mechanosensitive channel